VMRRTRSRSVCGIFDCFDILMKIRSSKISISHPGSMSITITSSKRSFPHSSLLQLASSTLSSTPSTICSE